MPEAPALRVLFFGTPRFALPSLRALCASRHQVVGVVSQPDRPRGRGRKLEPTPAHAEAERLSLPLLQPERVGETAALAWMRERAPDLGCVVAFGQFLPRQVRELPQHGLINAHASLLPRYRGAAPVAHALLAGEERTGVTIIRIEKEMDAGDWCARSELEIEPGENAGSLEERLATLAGPLLAESVDRIAGGLARFVPQNPAEASSAPKLTRGFGELDWTASVSAVLLRIRAATPRPGVRVRLREAGLEFRILEARQFGGPAPDPRPRAALGHPGTGASALLLGALDGWVEVLRLQVAGRRPTTAAEFLRGARLSETEEIEAK